MSIFGAFQKSRHDIKEAEARVVDNADVWSVRVLGQHILTAAFLDEIDIMQRVPFVEDVLVS